MAYQQGILAGKYASTLDVPQPQAHSRHFAQERGGAHSRHYEEGTEPEINALLAELRKISADLGVSIPHITLSWTLKNDFIASSIVGCRNVAQFKENIEASRFDIPADVMDRLDALTLPILEKLGDSPDYYENRKDSRIY